MVVALERMRVWTAADLRAMPDDPGQRYELVEGRLVKMSPTGGTHGRSSMDLGAHLALHVEQHRLGVVFGAETGFTILVACVCPEWRPCQPCGPPRSGGRRPRRSRR